MTTNLTIPCRCGDSREAHQHYRSGSDCSRAGCGCRHFRIYRLPGALRRPVLATA